MKKILTVGGGSGGHISPVVSVVKELFELKPDCEIKFWCDANSYDISVKSFNGLNVKIEKILSGKFRRYSHLKWWQHFTYLSILIPNVLDIFKIVGGFFQSFYKLIKWRPDVVFAKGGFVCLPVGLTAKLLKIKLVIHDSDTVPGLTNKILAKFADRIATGAPEKYYSYPKEKTVFTGIPTRSQFRFISTEQKKNIRNELRLPLNKKIILVTGGSQGSVILNNYIMKTAKLSTDDMKYILLTGKDNIHEVKSQIIQEKLHNILPIDFTNKIADYLLASDIAIARAGATTISEFGLSCKPSILIPNHRLTGDHQTKNAEMIEREGAAIILKEKEIDRDPSALINSINYLLDSNNRKTVLEMVKKLHKISKPDAAKRLAIVIVDEAQ